MSCDVMTGAGWCETRQLPLNQRVMRMDGGRRICTYDSIRNARNDARKLFSRAPEVGRARGYGAGWREGGGEAQTRRSQGVHPSKEGMDAALPSRIGSSSSGGGGSGIVKNLGRGGVKGEGLEGTSLSSFEEEMGREQGSAVAMISYHTIKGKVAEKAMKPSMSHVVTILDILRGAKCGDGGIGVGKYVPGSKSLAYDGATCSYNMVDYEERMAKKVQMKELRRRELLYQARVWTRRPVIPMPRGMNEGNLPEEEGKRQVLARYVRPVLPWLYLCDTESIQDDQLVEFASNTCMEKIHVIRMSEIESNGASEWPGPALGAHVAWMGATRLPSPAITAAGILHRLKHRFSSDAGMESMVMIMYDDANVNLSLHALVLFFYIYCGMKHYDARTLAGAAFSRQIPPASVIESGVEELAACGQGWLQRVIVKWPYAASKVEVAGELVGGWHVTKALVYNKKQKHWTLQLWGLPPGMYQYKFVVDGEWCVDLSAPSIIDEWGNSNNVVNVIKCAGAAQSIVHAAEEGDGMAATVGRSDLPIPGDGGQSMASSSSDMKEFILEPISTDERLRLATFGASVIAYYKKVSYS